MTYPLPAIKTHIVREGSRFPVCGTPATYIYRLIAATLADAITVARGGYR